MRYLYHCPNCDVETERVCSVDARNEQVCDCGGKLEIKLDLKSLGTRMRIPVYMMAATESSFPVDALYPKNEVERQIQREAGCTLEYEKRLY